MIDLLSATARLVDIPSVSRNESALADMVERELRASTWLEVDRVANNVVARSRGTGTRVVLAGHLDTVPVNHNATARIQGDTLFGLGSADMKAGVAVMLALAASPQPYGCEVTFAFYSCEEIEREHNGLLEVDRLRPDLLAGDVAVLGEPTGAVIEAGCQGVLKLEVIAGGARAHAARPWMGTNAIHRMAQVVALVAGALVREPVVDGCVYKEALSVVAIDGGVAANVIPDRCVAQINHRFAPDRDVTTAFTAVEELLAGVLDASAGDSISVVDSSPAAAPGLNHPLIAALLEATGKPARAKLGWTDAAFFGERGIPAVNFGPGDPQVAHTRDEHVSRQDLESVYTALVGMLG